MLLVEAVRRDGMARECGDDELVARSARGDKDAYRILVERYERKALALAFEVTGSREDAEDVVQEGFVKAYLSLGSFKGDSSFYTWLYRIIYNMAIDLRRRVVRQGGAAVEFDEGAAAGSDGGGIAADRFAAAPEVIMRRQDMERFRQLMSELSAEHRAVIMLREVEGLSYEQIADALGINKGTVMSRLFYARKKLQRGLSEEDAAAWGGRRGFEAEAFEKSGALSK